MSHVCGRTSLAKDKASKVFYRKIKPVFKDTLPMGKVGTDRKCRNCKSESQQKKKTLRTRKERNQIRDGGKEAPRAKSCHHYCQHETSKDVSYVHQCCHNTLDVLPNIVHVTHEPSVITDSRLIGHHGLFNHEVKSIDIERLLSEQRKLDRSEKLQEKSNSEFANLSTKGSLLDSSNEEAVISNRKDSQTPRILNYSKRQEKKTMESNNQVSDLTPGQKLRKTAISSTESNKNDNSSDVVITGMTEAQPGMYANNSESHQTSCSFNENKNILPGSEESFIEQTPQKHASATNPRQISQPTPLLPFSPPMAGASSSLIAEQENLDADSVDMSVKAIAASLCNCICFSLLGKRDLVAESREALVKVLRQRHGPQLKSNILKIQRQLYSCDDAQEESSELCWSPILADRKEGTFSPGNVDCVTLFTRLNILCIFCCFSAEFPAQSKTTDFATSSFEKTGRLFFDWHSNYWSNPLDKHAELLGTSPENPVVPDSTFSHRASPQFLDFEFRNALSRERGYLFSPSFAPSCVDGPRSSGHVDDFFISTHGQEFAVPHQENKNYMAFSDITAVSHRRNLLASNMNNYSAEPLHSASVPFPHMNSSLETHRKAFSNEIPYFDQKSSFEPSSHVSFPLDSPAIRPLDLAHYPPSYMLEKGPILPTSSSFLSPEHWSFPPMRLY